MAEPTTNGHKATASARRKKGALPPAEIEAYDSLRRELSERLVALRAEFREAIVNYSIQVQGVMTRVGESLADATDELSPTELKARLRSLREALEALDDLNLKPTKGRRRDLKSIEEYVVHLSHSIGEW
jgi:hypothetical protein